MSRLALNLSVAASLLALGAAPAFGQLAGGAAEVDRSLNFVSAGAAYLPDYTGSDDYRVIPFGAVRWQIGDIVTRSDGPGLAVDLYRNGSVTAGVFGRWAAGRNDVDDAVVSLLPEIDNSIIAGGFVDVMLAENFLTGFDRFAVNLRIGADILGRFEGAAWTGSATYTTALSRTSLFVLSASVSGFSDDYADTLFSIDAAGATASGLQAFQAEGGVQDIGLTSILTVGVGGEWNVSGILGVSQLQGDFADSPIVAVRGSETQVFTGVALGRRF